MKLALRPRSSALRVWFTVLCSLFSVHAAAQQWTPPDSVWLTSIGLGVHGSMISHTGSFTLPQAPTCCPEYSGATSFGFVPSLFIRQELGKVIRLSLRGSYIPYDATFTTTESLLLTGNVNGTSEHTLDTKMSWLGGELMAEIGLVGGLRLLAGAGVGAMMSPTFSQKETLITPDTGTFENGLRVRNNVDDVDLENVTTPRMHIVGGLGYDFPVTQNHSVIISPELTYTLGMSPIIDGVDWNANVLRAGVTVGFALNAATPPKPIERKRETYADSLIVDIEPDATYRRTDGLERSVFDTVETEDVITITEKVYRTDTAFVPIPPDVRAAIAVKAVDANNATKELFQVTVSTQFITEALPVLPVVFFESQSISLSFRYHQVSRPSEFSVDAIPPRTTSVHREILNIVGQRLRDNPTATIRLRGTADPTTEAGDCSLARKRAEAVKQYLTSVWTIDGSRITIAEGTGSCAPEKATRQPSEEGFSENRRVEIETEDLEILQSVARRRFNEARSITPPKLLFDPAGTTMRWVKKWDLKAVSGSTELFSRQGEGAPTSIVHEVSTPQAEGMMSGKPVDVILTVHADRGIVASDTASLAVKKDTLSTELERLTLTLFDVASDKVTPIAESQIKQFIKQVPAGSTVVVRGYADMLGNVEFNRKLSQRRAEAVCGVLQQSLNKKVTLVCDEIRTDAFPPGIDSYATPEERFLSRTVQIEVKRSR